MPKIVYKAPKPRKRGEYLDYPEETSPEDGFETAYLRASDEQIEAAEVGEKYTVVLEAVVTGVSSRERKVKQGKSGKVVNVKHNNMDLEIHSFELYPAEGENEFAQNAGEQGET